MNFTGNINDINIQLKKLLKTVTDQQKQIVTLTTIVNNKATDENGAIVIADIDASQVSGLDTLLADKSSIFHSHEVQELLQSGAVIGQVITWTGIEWAPETISVGSAGVFDLDGGTATVYTGTPDINGGGA
jgi:hypothetical protein